MSAAEAIAQRIFGNAGANKTRINWIKRCATLCARNARKGNGWLLKDAPGPKAWNQGWDEGRRPRCPGRLPEMARAPAGRSFLQRKGERRLGFRASLRYR